MGNGLNRNKLEEVTDSSLLARLNGIHPSMLQPVEDEGLLARLNGTEKKKSTNLLSREFDIPLSELELYSAQEQAPPKKESLQEFTFRKFVEEPSSVVREGLNRILDTETPKTGLQRLGDVALGSAEVLASPFAVVNPLIEAGSQAIEQIPVVGKILSPQKNLENLSRAGGVVGESIGKGLGLQQGEVETAKKIGEFVGGALPFVIGGAAHTSLKNIKTKIEKGRTPTTAENNVLRQNGIDPKAPDVAVKLDEVLKKAEAVEIPQTPPSGGGRVARERVEVPETFKEPPPPLTNEEAIQHLQGMTDAKGNRAYSDLEIGNMPGEMRRALAEGREYTGKLPQTINRSELIEASPEEVARLEKSQSSPQSPTVEPPSGEGKPSVSPKEKIASPVSRTEQVAIPTEETKAPSTGGVMPAVTRTHEELTPPQPGTGGVDIPKSKDPTGDAYRKGETFTLNQARARLADYQQARVDSPTDLNNQYIREEVEGFLMKPENQAKLPQELRRGGNNAYTPEELPKVLDALETKPMTPTQQDWNQYRQQLPLENQRGKESKPPYWFVESRLSKNEPVSDAEIQSAIYGYRSMNPKEGLPPNLKLWEYNKQHPNSLKTKEEGEALLKSLAGNKPEMKPPSEAVTPTESTPSLETKPESKPPASTGGEKKAIFRSAALKYKGKVYEGVSHADAAEKAGFKVEDEKIPYEDYGFVTNEGKFVAQHEAEKMVKNTTGKNWEGITAEEAIAEGLQSPTGGVEKSGETLISEPLHEQPKVVAEAIQDKAKDLKAEALGWEVSKAASRIIHENTGEGYTNTFRSGGAVSTFPKWFNELGVPKKKVLEAIDKIIQDKGKDNGKLVEELKSIILKEGTEGADRPQGFIPPDENFAGLIEAHKSGKLDEYLSGTEFPFKSGEPAKFDKTEAGLQGNMFDVQAQMPKGKIKSDIPLSKQIEGTMFEAEKPKGNTSNLFSPDKPQSKRDSGVAPSTIIPGITQKQMEKLGEKIASIFKGAAEKIESGELKAEGVKDFVKESLPKDMPTHDRAIAEEMAELAQAQLGKEPPKQTTPDRTIGLNKTEQDKIREYTGLDKLEPVERRGWEEVLNTAKTEKLDESALTIADEVMQRSRMISDKEHAGIVLKAAELANEYEQRIKTVSDLIEKGDTAGASQETTRANLVIDQIDKLTDASRMGRREVARALSIGRMMVNRETYKLADVIQRAQATKGARLTEAESTKIQDLVQKHKNLEAQLKLAEERNLSIVAENERLKAQRLTKREADKSAISQNTTTRREKIADEREDIKGKLKALGLRVNDVTGLTAEASYLIGKLAVSYIKEGTVKLDDVVKKVLADLPELSSRDVYQSLLTKDPTVQSRAISETNKQIGRLKTQAKLLLDIEKAEQGIFDTKKPKDAQISDVANLRARLKELRALAYKSTSDATRLEKAITTINELQDQLDNHYRNIRTSKGETPAPLQAMREKIQSLRKEIAVEDEMLDLKEQLRTNVFKTKPTREAKPVSPELQHRQIQLQRLRRDIKATIESLKPRTIKSTFGEAVRELRTLKATGDISATLRQNVVAAFSHPIQMAKQSVPAIRAAFNSYTADQIDNSLRNSPNSYLYEKSGLKLLDLESSPSAREEMFNSRLVEKIPVFGEIVKGSNRHMTTIGNLIRTSLFDDFIKKNPNATTPEMKAYANFLNVSSGIGDLGKFAQAADGLSLAFFAPKLAVSRVQTPYLLAKYWNEPRVRKQMMRDLGGFVATGGAILGLAALGGASVSADPRDADFGKIRIGNTRIDIWGGFQQPARLITRIGMGITDKAGLTGENLSESQKKVDPIELIGRFASYKFAPAVTLGRELYTGKTAVGEPTTIPETFLDTVTPLMIGDMRDAYKENGAGSMVGVGGLSLLGVGTNTYRAKQQRKATFP